MYCKLFNNTMTDNESETADAAKLLKSEMATRRGKLGVCTRKINEIKNLLVENGDVEKVNANLEVLLACIRDFNSVHSSVQIANE